MQFAGRAFHFARMRWLPLAACIAALSVEGAETVWRPAQAPLMTRWSKTVARGQTHTEYPRPQLVRKDWLNLNGLWDYTLTSRGAPLPAEFPERILVPFPIESALSGVMLTNLDEKKRIWYRRKVALPAAWADQRVLLHFGAVDFEATVFVNGQQLGQHRGGYDAFSFDITDAVAERNKELEIIVAVWDPTDAAPNPRGKQVRRPDKGIFYTSSSGIWQTVWLEPVPSTSIESIKVRPDIDAGGVHVTVAMRGDVGKNDALDIVVIDAGGGEVASAGGVPGREIFLPIPRAKLWTPDSPYLYNLAVTWERKVTEDKLVPLDKVTGYFGMRKVALGQVAGVTKILLNNEPFFMMGPLDQGFWPDGLYTAPSDEALRYDIEMTKKLGFNMARKHVKVEPDRWYYWCDKLGLLVWQDMPSGDRSIGPRDSDITRSAESSAQFERELKAMIDGRYNHPCIVMWVVFNEGWGQYDTARLTKWVADYDSSRLVNNASGWSDRGVGDVMDMHR
jgi:beta-galactosidase/beta-glucuronidase